MSEFPYMYFWLGRINGYDEYAGVFNVRSWPIRNRDYYLVFVLPTVVKKPLDFKRGCTSGSAQSHRGNFQNIGSCFKKTRHTIVAQADYVNTKQGTSRLGYRGLTGLEGASALTVLQESSLDLS